MGVKVRVLNGASPPVPHEVNKLESNWNYLENTEIKLVVSFCRYNIMYIQERSF
jgi:hypothetical protein